MNRRGFALLTVLWMVALLGSAAGTGLWLARDVISASDNRVLLARAEWARNACEELVYPSWPLRGGLALRDSVDLGEGLWCKTAVADPRSKLSLNHASRAQLLALVGVDSLVAAALDWRDADEMPARHGAESPWYRLARKPLPRNGPFVAVEELTLVRGWSPALVDHLAPFLTVAGDGLLNLNRAAPELLALVPGLNREAVTVFLNRRATRRPIQSGEELLELLSSPSRTELLNHYREFSQVAAWGPGWLEVTVTGGLRARKPIASSRLRIVEAEGRSAVLRREVE